MLLHRTRLHRRSLLALAAAGLALPLHARAQDARMSPRALGNPKAPVSVMEFFSLTCTHCAAFANETFPDVKSKLVDTGKLYYVFRDFPLDQVALTAAMVARSLPPDRYEPFILALFHSQDRWAFARDVNTTDELAKMAALAGMPRDTFNTTIADTKLRNAILAEQDAAEKKYGIDSTPTFIFNGPKAHDMKQAGEMGYDAFDALVKQAGG